ncbi:MULTISPECIES: LuxR C-terminal-related transcriptional regulator [unclassified Nocardioides]|uniref:LuxR C-terminal-related transcriptional regulator n=1 Tax=unclassified Nocardioides TaxID=2615069 RepID=UPI00361D312E
MPGDDERALRQPDGLGLLAAQSRSARTAIFPSKLRPAANPAYLLTRPRLHALMDESVRAPLTLVVAPAGSGKTSLLRSWAAHTSLPLAWLSLDEDDRDAVQLWRGVLAALEGVAPGCAAAAADMIRRPGRLLGAVGVLLDDLEGRDDGDAVLVIDDLHLVDEEEAVAESLALFVQHLPPWLHVVVASRRAPRLPVHRLRARGQVGEVHFPELRFSFEEASSMLGRIAPTLDSDVVAEIAARAGGWAASLQLAALAARSSQARGLPPGDEDDRPYVEDYVWREVLANEPGELVQALLATSIVRRIDPGLAQVLTGRSDAPELLAQAEERGLFLTRIEPSGTFEIHTLVREVLQSMLARQSPERRDQLHSWAAGWHEAHGQVVSGLEHWMRANRPQRALRLLAAQAQALYDGGHENTILRVVRSLPEVGPADGFDAMLDYAWCHLLVDRRRFTGLVDRLARMVRGDVDLDPIRGARLEVLESIAATLRGHWQDGASLARSALETFGDSWWLDPLGQFAWNMIGRDVALSESWDDSGQAAQGVIRALSVVPERRTALEGTRALAEALAGHPVDALRLVSGARTASEVGNMTILRTELLAAEAVAHRELGDHDLAVPMLVELVESRIEPAPHCQLLGLLELAHARFGETDLDAAQRAFGAAAELVDTEMPGPGARSWLGRTGATLAIAADDIDTAHGWAGEVVDDFWSAVVTARVHLATGEDGRATDALKSAVPRCVRHRVIADLLLSRAVASPEAADLHLIDAVRVASGHGLVQTVAAEGPDVLDRIERLAWHAPPGWLDRLRRAGQVGGASVEPAIELVEELTDRELEVLRMLASRLTLREIADELFISINTLKFHLKVIYRKLGCSSRAEAAEVARAMTSLRRKGQPSSTRRR